MVNFADLRPRSILPGDNTPEPRIVFPTVYATFRRGDLEAPDVPMHILGSGTAIRMGFVVEASEKAGWIDGTTRYENTDIPIAANDEMEYDDGVNPLTRIDSILRVERDQESGRHVIIWREGQ